MCAGVWSVCVCVRVFPRKVNKRVETRDGQREDLLSFLAA